MAKLAPQRDRKARRSARGRLCPQVHALEDRCLLSGLFTDFPLLTPGTEAAAITTGPDGNLWFTETSAHRIGRITPTGVITEFALPAGSRPIDITTGPDGDLWFTDNGRNLIGRITPAGSISEFPLPANGANGLDLSGAGGPAYIAAGPDGNLWFTEQNSSRLGRVTLSGTVTEFELGEIHAVDLTAGPDGNLWVTDGQQGRIARVTPTGKVTTFVVAGTDGIVNQVVDITAGPDGSLWFTGGPSDQYIDRIAPTGVVTQFALLPDHAATGILAGPDGKLWFSEAHEIGWIDPTTTTITEFTTSTSISAHFTFGPDGNIWFAAAGRVQLLHQQDLVAEAGFTGGGEGFTSSAVIPFVIFGPANAAGYLLRIEASTAVTGSTISFSVVFDFSGYISWASHQDHGNADWDATQAIVPTSRYGTQSAESLSSVPRSRAASPATLALYFRSQYSSGIQMDIPLAGKPRSSLAAHADQDLAALIRGVPPHVTTVGRLVGASQPELWDDNPTESGSLSMRLFRPEVDQSPGGEAQPDRAALLAVAGEILESDSQTPPADTVSPLKFKPSLVRFAAALLLSQTAYWTVAALRPAHPSASTAQGRGVTGRPPVPIA